MWHHCRLLSHLVFHSQAGFFRLAMLRAYALTCVWYRQVAWANEHADELTKTGAAEDGAEIAEQVAKGARNT